MAFTATIKNIQAINTQIVVSVQYHDDATNFLANNQFSYLSDGSVTQQQAVNDITAQGQVYKNSLAVLATLLNKIGSVITL